MAQPQGAFVPSLGPGIQRTSTQAPSVHRRNRDAEGGDMWVGTMDETPDGRHVPRPLPRRLSVAQHAFDTTLTLQDLDNYESSWDLTPEVRFVCLCDGPVQSSQGSQLTFARFLSLI